jgi:hypothetical protein
MSMMNEYLVSILVDQRARELQRDAREYRLAQQARGVRPSWWGRLTGHRGAGNAAGRAASRPVPAAQHVAAR